MGRRLRRSDGADAPQGIGDHVESGSQLIRLLASGSVQHWAMDWASGLFSLMGVALGAGASVTVQTLNQREARWRMQSERSVAQRAERKEAILAFLAAVQPVEEALENRA